MTGVISNRQLEIIEAAGKIFSSSGAGGLTIKNLAHEMKFSESAIYRHFTSKEEIIIAMLDYLAETMNKRLEQVVSPEKNPKENLMAIFSSQFSFFKKNPHFVVAVFCDGLLEESQQINQSILRIMGVKRKHVMPVITQGQQKGIFTSHVAAEELVHIIMGTFRLHMFKWRMAGFKPDLKRSGEQMLQTLLTLIETR